MSDALTITYRLLSGVSYRTAMPSADARAALASWREGWAMPGQMTGSVRLETRDRDDEWLTVVFGSASVVAVELSAYDPALLVAANVSTTTQRQR